uniref:Putative secreted protein n=1 Tax=Anopheles darlingi TaxID=43151 RepID=A0A2M4DPZ1_ANODA
MSSCSPPPLLLCWLLLCRTFPNLQQPEKDLFRPGTIASLTGVRRTVKRGSRNGTSASENSLPRTLCLPSNRERSSLVHFLR